MIPRRPLAGGEVFGKGLEVPGNPIQDREVDLFDPGEDLLHGFSAARVGRRQAEAAVAANHGSDAVEAGGGGEGIEGDLGIVVGMRIDEARRDDASLGLEYAARLRSGNAADVRDPAVCDGDVRDAPGRPRSIDHDSVGAEQLGYGIS